MTFTRRDFLRVAATGAGLLALPPYARTLANPADLARLPVDLNDGYTVLVPPHPDDEIIITGPGLVERARLIAPSALPAGPGQVRAYEKSYKKTLSVPYVFSQGTVDQTTFSKEVLLSRGVASEQDRLVRLCAERDRRFGYETVYRALKPVLAAQKTQAESEGEHLRVVTEAPWGGYGHRHHRLLSAVVRALAVDLGFEAWFPACVRPRIDLVSPDGALYKDVLDLPHVRYSTPVLVDHTLVASLRENFRNETLDETPFTGKPMSAWSWWGKTDSESVYDYAHTKGNSASSNGRYYWCCVERSPLKGGDYVDLLGIYPDLLERVLQIRTDHEGAPEDERVPPSYSCPASYQPKGCATECKSDQDTGPRSSRQTTQLPVTRTLIPE